MIRDESGVCRHGSSKNCSDCLKYMLEDLHKLLKDPDAPLLVSTGAYKGLLRQIDYATRSLNSYDTESESEPPRARAIPGVTAKRSFSPSNRFRPETVFGSAWGESAAPLDTPKKKKLANEEYVIGKASPKSPGALMPFVKRRSSWTPAEVSVLKEAYSVHPRQWEKMRQTFPELKKYTGMQLHDKHKSL